MPSLKQWLIVRGVNAASRIAAALGDEDSKRINAKYDAKDAQLKTMKKIHEYAASKGISHTQAMRELGVVVSPDVLASFQDYDPTSYR